MASWKDNLTDAEVDALYKYKTQGKDALSDAEVDLVYPYKQYLTSPTTQPSPKTSDWTRAGKSAVEAAVPAMGGLAAGAYGASLGSAGGPIGAIVGGLIGGLGGSIGVGKLQEGVTSYIPEAVKERLGFGAQQRAQEVSESPTASFLGGFAPNLAAFNVGKVAPIVTEAGRVIGPWAQRAGMAGVGSAVEAGQQAIGDAPMNWTNVALSGALQGTFASPTKLGEKFMGKFEYKPTGNSKIDAMNEQQSKIDQERATFTPNTAESMYVQLQREKQHLLSQPRTEEVKTRIIEINNEITTLNKQLLEGQQKAKESAFAPENQFQDIKNALAGFDRQVQRNGPPSGGAPIHVTSEGQALTNPIFEPHENVQQAKDTAAAAERQARDSELAQRAGAGFEQAPVFDPHADMHRAYTDMWLADEKGQPRVMTTKEFGKTMENLTSEPGTTMRMPEDLGAAYQSYLEHVNPAQGDLFRNAHETLQHINYGEMSAAAKGKATKELNKIGPITEDLLARGASTYEQLHPHDQAAANAALDVIHGTATPEAPSVRDAAGNLLDALMEQSGAKLNFMPGGALSTAVKDFAVALFNAGYNTVSRAMEAARTFLGDKWSSISKQLAEAFHIYKAGKMTGETIPPNESAENILSSALNEGKDGKGFNLTESGATLAGMKRESSLITNIGRVVQRAGKLTDIGIRNWVFPTEKAWRSLSSNELSEVVSIFRNEATNQRVFDEGVLKEHLSVKQLEAYARMREMFDATYNAQNAVRINKGQTPITKLEYYSSSRWEGAFRQPVRDAQGKPVWYLAADSKAGLKTQADALLKQYPNLKLDPKESSHVSVTNSKKDVETAYSTMLDILDRNDPAVQAMKKHFEETQQIEGEFTRNQTKHFEEKNNIRGFVGDRPGQAGFKEDLAWVEEQMQYGKNALTWANLQEAMDTVKGVLSDERLREQQPNNVAYAREYVKNALGQGQSTVARAIEDALRKGGISTMSLNAKSADLKSFFILQKLATSAGYTLAQFVQLGGVIPMLADLRAKGYNGNPVKAMAVGTGAGMGLGLAHHMRPAEAEIAHLFPTPFLREMFKYSEENGVASSSAWDESKISSSFSNMGRLANVLGKTISIPDSFTRGIAFATYAQMLKDSGKFSDNVKLFQKAEELVNVSMVDYRQTERPLAFSKAGAAGNLLNTLQTYPINFYNQYGYWVREAAKGNVVPFIAALGVQYLTAGVMGVPGVEDATKLVDFVKQHLPAEQYAQLRESEFLSNPKEWVIDHLGQSALYGSLSTETGISFSSRVAAPGLGEMTQSPLAAPSDAAKQLLSLSGAVLDSTNHRKAAQVAMNSLPTGLQGVFEMSPMAEGLTYEKRPSGKIGVFKTSDLAHPDVMVERTPEEASLRRFGLKSQRETLERDLTYQNKATKKLDATKAGELVKDAVVALKDGNAMKFNRLNNLHAKLTGKSIAEDQLYQQQLSASLSELQSQMMSAKNPADMVRIAKTVKRLQEAQ